VATTNDTITYAGNRGARLNGGNGNDKLTGGSGGDVLDGGAGSDALIGAGGNDTYLFANSAVAETDIVTELTVAASIRSTSAPARWLSPSSSTTTQPWPS
jgi:Ca2+-binding RTX toxin-like protein